MRHFYKAKNCWPPIKYHVLFEWTLRPFLLEAGKVKAILYAPNRGGQLKLLPSTFLHSVFSVVFNRTEYPAVSTPTWRTVKPFSNVLKVICGQKFCAGMFFEENFKNGEKETLQNFGSSDTECLCYGKTRIQLKSEQSRWGLSIRDVTSLRSGQKYLWQQYRSMRISNIT